MALVRPKVVTGKVLWSAGIVYADPVLVATMSAVIWGVVPEEAGLGTMIVGTQVGFG